MNNISPKVIDVEGNRIETDDKLFRKTTELDKIKDYRITDEILYYYTKIEYGETSRFPTQLFTNNNDEKFKYIKRI